MANTILEQYKKTFVRMQLTIAVVTGFVYFGLHRLWQLSALFFVTMQLASLLGAMWGARLRRKVERSVA